MPWPLTPTTRPRLNDLAICWPNMASGRGDRRCHRRLAALSPDTLLGRLSRAKVLAEEGDEAAFEACLSEAVRSLPDSSDAKRLLATLLQEQGRFDEAIPLLEAATRDRPTRAAIAFHDLVAAKKITGADRPILDRMRTLLALRRCPKSTIRRCISELGKALDDLGEYESAMRHFDMANAIVRRARRSTATASRPRSTA